MINYFGGTIIKSHFLSYLSYRKRKSKINGRNVAIEEYIYECYYILKHFDENDKYYFLT